MTTTPAERDAVSRIPDNIGWMNVARYIAFDCRECVNCSYLADTECTLGSDQNDEPQDCPGAEFEV